MRQLCIFIFISLFLPSATSAPIPKYIQRQMKKYTWQPSCPVPLNQLEYLTIPYWGFDNNTHRGHLIIYKKIAKEVQMIFKILYESHFPIQRIRPMYRYKGNDIAAMKANNTSAFNCRAITGKTNVFSRHSFGVAIDINPLINPYIKDNKVLPPNAKPYLERNPMTPGLITQHMMIYRLFTQHNWAWGGNWTSLKDYQHFEKKINL